MVNVTTVKKEVKTSHKKTKPPVKTIVRTVVKEKPKYPKKSGPKKPKSNLVNYFASHMLAPGIFGPFKQPRAGGGSRTGLAIDTTEFQIIGDAVTNTVKGIQAGSFFNGSGSALYYAVANETTSFGAGSIVNVNSQFPSPIQMADINLTAVDIMVYTTGNYTSVAGELIIGASIPVATGANYGGMYFYPGTVRVPIVSLLDKPLRISGRKQSSAADEFLPVTAGMPDWDLPFIFTSGLPTGIKVVTVITRTWEYRSTTSSTNVIPYETISKDFTKDYDAYQNSRSVVGNMPQLATLAAEDGYIETIGKGLGIAGNWAKGASAAMTIGAFGIRLVNGMAGRGPPMHNQERNHNLENAYRRYWNV